MLVTVFSLLLFSVLLISCFSPYYGLCLYWTYLILVPCVKIQILSFSFGVTLIALCICVFCFFLRGVHNKNSRDHVFSPFFFLYFSFLFFLPFSSSYFLFSIKFYFQELFGTLLVSFLLYVILVSRKKINFCLYSIYVTAFIVIVYGLSLILTPGVNSYVIGVLSAFGQDIDNMQNFYSDESRMFGRISSVFLHPMNLGLYLGFLMIFSFYAYQNKFIKKSILLPFSIGAISLILFCGVRTPIFAGFVSFVFFFFRMKNRKLGTNLILISLSFVSIILLIPGMDSYLLSITEFNGSEAGGSSLSMRLDQLMGCFNEIRNDLFLGHGYEWHEYYNQIIGPHPILYGFESLIFVILCDQGIIGLFVWIFFCFYYFHCQKDIFFQLIFVYYLSYSVTTGEFGYMKYFLFFFSVMSAMKFHIIHKSLKLKN
jgi:hypothetical protein